MNDSSVDSRRGFIARALAASATLLATARRLPAMSHAGTPGLPVAGRAPQDPDWMTALTGKHRTVFDVAAHKDGKPLAQSTNYLDAWRDAFQTPERELNLVVGVHGEAIPIVLVDSLWARFQLASQYGIGTALKEVPARNIFLTPSASATTLVRPDQTVAALQARGVKILICMNSIEGAAAKLSAAGFGASAQVRGALLDGIVPGVILVPAMVVALTQLQARGLSYIKIS